MDDTLKQFLTILWRGGRWASYSTDKLNSEGKKIFITKFHPASKPPDPDKRWKNIWMAVYPRRELLTGGKRGGNDDVALMNCFYAEWDAEQARTLAEIESLQPTPSVIIASGGDNSYHAYWLFKDTVFLTDDNREEIRKLQARWVKWLGGDPGVSDLARVLRLPGTLNYKYNPPRLVKFIRANFGTRYTLEELTAALPVEKKYTPPPSTYTPTYQTNGDQAERAASALKRLVAWRCHDKDPWIEVGLSLCELGETGLQLWDEWSKNDAEKYNPGECARRWKTFKPGAGLTLGSLFWMADQDDPQSKKNDSNGHTPMTDFIDIDTLDQVGEEPADFAYLDQLERQNEGINDHPERKNGSQAALESPDDSIPPNAQQSVHFSTFATLAEAIGPIEWDWEPWIPCGMLTILASVSGEGKSAILMRICGSYIKGLCWPDDTRNSIELGCVLWCEAEAAQALNLERARNWDYPLNKIITPFDDPLTDVNLDNDAHQAAITRRAFLPEVKFIAVDSLSGSTSRKENDTEIKKITEYLARLARDTNKPLMLTHHLNKPNRSMIGGNVVTLDRLRGSSAIVQHARVIWALDAPDPDDTEIKRLLMIKNNLRKFAKPLGVVIGSDGVHFTDAPRPPHQESAADRAATFISELLAPGPMLSEELQADCKANGISWATANRVKVEMGYKAYKQDKKWYWKLG